MNMPPWMRQEVRRDFDPEKVVRVTPRLRRITAPNPGVMTGPGTNTWLVGSDELAVVDPGPDVPEHVERIAAAGAGRIRWILITHTHPDHSPGSRHLARLTGAPVYSHPLQLQGVRDTAFRPDRHLNDGDVIKSDDFSLRALHTPGHAANHLCFLLEEERILIAGDQVMDKATVVISPPDGDMQAYLTSLERLKTLGLKGIAPAHGRLLEEPDALLQRIIDHRMDREAMVLDAVVQGDRLIPAMVKRIYTDVPEVLHRAAEGSVHAHLLKLRAEGKVRGDSREGEWRIV
ncbi:MAG: MBL fold metallo-hydrolase [Aquisalimonadaceae bacterium]